MNCALVQSLRQLMDEGYVAVMKLGRFMRLSVVEVTTITGYFSTMFMQQELTPCYRLHERL